MTQTLILPEYIFILPSYNYLFVSHFLLFTSHFHPFPFPSFSLDITKLQRIRHSFSSPYLFSILSPYKREQDLISEIDRLKSLIFQVQQERDEALERIEVMYLERIAVVVKDEGTREDEVK